MGDPGHFDRHADLYERARPPYPDELWARLRELELLEPGAEVLDLGAGTGKATGPLLDAGLRVTAVEPGPALASTLRERYPAIRLIAETAEDAALPAASFDLAVAATSVHWMDLDVVLPKLHRALRPGGQFAVWRNVYGDPLVGTAFRDELARITARRDGPPRPGPAEDDVEGWVAVLTARGLFELAHRDVFRWSIRLDADGVRDLFTTFSDWSAEEVAEAAEAVQRLGGSVTEHYLTPLIVLRRSPQP